MIITGDALSELRTIKSSSVEVCITSPPYFNLRDYGAEGQIGLEPTPTAAQPPPCEKRTRGGEVSKKYRKKVAPVEAVKWTGDNYEEVVAFIAGTAAAGISQWPYRGNPHENRTHYAREPRLLMIKTKHRDLYCRTGDYVIKNEIGDLQTCGGRHFEREYEEVEEQGERRVARPIHDGICVACGAPVPEGTWVCPQCKEDPFHAIKEKEHRDE